MAQTYDLIIRNGLIVDGSGGEPYRGDVAVQDGVIAAVGKVAGEGREEIDADGKVVTPGFVDVHTHYDGQTIWSDRLNPSSGHGVTTVVMGNCGVGFAPCRPADHELLIQVMEGVEDIPGAVMADGLDWAWESFPQFLDAADARPHDIDFAAYLPHSPLRVYAMGDRGANREVATPEDLQKMSQIAREAVEAGALGFATSRLFVHKRPDGEYIPSFEAAYAELEAIAAGMNQTGVGILQIAPDSSPGWRETLEPLVEIGRRTGAPVTFSYPNRSDRADMRRFWDDIRGILSKANAEGVKIFGQVYPRPIGMVMGLEASGHPFALSPSYLAIKDLPLAERVAKMRDPALKAKIMGEEPADGHPLIKLCRNFDQIFRMEKRPDYEPDLAKSVASLAKAKGVAADDLAYDMLLENDGHALLWIALTNFPGGSLDDIGEVLEDDHIVMGLGDGGAHYGMICDSSWPTFVLAHWARDRQGRKMSLAQAIEMLSAKPAKAIGFLDRGLLRPGYKADLNIIDVDALALHEPEVVKDLPGGGRRLDQRADGYVATVVSGQVIQRNGQPTAARPGRLVRGVQPAPAGA